MPKLTPDDLLAAAPGALRGTQPSARTMLQEVQQRTQERAREAVRTRLQRSDQTPATRPKPPAPTPVPPVAPNWPVEIRLHKGQRVRATLVPGAARREDLAAIRDVSAANDRQAFEALQQQGEALEALRKSHAELVGKVAAIQAQADRSIVGLLQGMAGLEQRLQTAKVQERVLRTQTLSARRLATRQQRAMSSMTTTARIHQVNSVVNSMQAAAFGEKGSLLATNNLLLAANQLLWQFIDPILRGMGFPLGPSPSLLMWLSPVGSLLTGQVVLGNRQHVRFVSGVATFDGTTFVVTESLRKHLASGFFDEFRRRTNVVVTLVPLIIDAGINELRATVEDGVLIIRAETDDQPTGDVGWMVDTGVDGG